MCIKLYSRQAIKKPSLECETFFLKYISLSICPVSYTEKFCLYSKKINWKSFKWNPHNTDYILGSTFRETGIYCLYLSVTFETQPSPSVEIEHHHPSHLFPVSVLSRCAHLNRCLRERQEVWTGPFRGENGVHTNQLTFKFSEDQARGTFKVEVELLLADNIFIQQGFWTGSKASDWQMEERSNGNCNRQPVFQTGV